jgi:hypothetical protein
MVEHLLYEHKALNSSPSPTKKNSLARISATRPYSTVRENNEIHI